MPSRKKAQGKARKSAKAEIAAEAARKNETLETQLRRLNPEEGEFTDDEICNMCTHGYNPDNLCPKFVKHFLQIVGRYSLEEKPHSVATELSRNKYPQVWTSLQKLAPIRWLFLGMGTNCVLSGDIDLARQCASCANYFKIFIEDFYYEGRGMQAGVNKTTELFVSDEHTLVRYLQKHIFCSCLDDKYEEVKSVKKMGFCNNPQCTIPDRRTVRSSMLYCTRCRQLNYCSRECQEGHWRAGHKEECKIQRMERKAHKSRKKSWHPPK